PNIGPSSALDPNQANSSSHVTPIAWVATVQASTGWAISPPASCGAASGWASVASASSHANHRSTVNSPPGNVRPTCAATSSAEIPAVAPVTSDIALPVGPVRLTQGTLEDLAGGRLRQFGDEVDRLGFLVSGQMLAGLRDDVLLGDRLPRLQHHHGLHRLAPLVVRHTDDRTFQHRRMPRDRLLDLDAEDVLAAGDDHVLRAVDDVDVALVVPRGDVAGPHPPAAGRDAPAVASSRTPPCVRGQVRPVPAAAQVGLGPRDALAR